MKLIFNLSLILFMLIAVIQPVYANTNQDQPVNTKIQKDEAIEIAKAKVNIPEEYKITGVYFNSSWGYPNTPAWYINWTFEENSTIIGSINVAINSETGEILSLDTFNNTNENAFFPAKVSITEAKKIADEYIASIFPDLLEKIEVEANYIEEYKPSITYPINYYFPYRYIINGIPYEDNKIYVSVNGNGVVTSFNYRYPSDLEFEDPTGYIPLEEAKTKYSEYMDMGLRYLFSYLDYSQNAVPYLTFNSSITTNIIDAKTGELFTYPGSIITQSYEPLVDKPLASDPEEKEKELTQEDAIKVAKDYLSYFGNTSELTNSNIYYNSNYYINNRSVWEISWYEESSKYYYSMVINAKTGELLNYYNYNYEQPSNTDTNKLTNDEAKNIAIETVKQLAPSKANQVYLQEYMSYQEPSLEYAYFHFPRLVHGIPTERDYIRVSINLKTGNVMEYGMTWDTAKYPEELPLTIDENKAKEEILKKLDLELVYITQYTPNTGTTPQKPTTKLVYKPANSYSPPKFLDATTGQWKNREDGTLIDKIKPADLSGHWAEKELQLMVDYNALDLIDGKILPNKALTRGELVKMFLMASNGGRYYFYQDYGQQQTFKDVGPDSPYYRYIEDAVRQNLITVDESKEFKPDEAVAREELAQFIVKALGYDKLAQTEGLFKQYYKDQNTSKYPGHISIVTAAKIMLGDGTNFNPKGEVTRASAAVAFYRYLGVRNTYQERPFGTYYYF